MEDIKTLHLTPDVYTRTSDHFELCLTYAEQLIKDGNAFCDDTPFEEVKELREKKEPSSKRDQCKYEPCLYTTFTIHPRAVAPPAPSRIRPCHTYFKPSYVQILSPEN